MLSIIGQYRSLTSAKPDIGIFCKNTPYGLKIPGYRPRNHFVPDFEAQANALVSQRAAQFRTLDQLRTRIDLVNSQSDFILQKTLIAKIKSRFVSK
ncbi:MAG: hypothetical protein U1F20_03670 [Lysobacterales bacterium]